MFAGRRERPRRTKRGSPESSETVIHITGPVRRPAWYEFLQEEIAASHSTCVVIDLSGVRRARTAEFAQLVKIKSVLRQRGQDMRIEGLRGQPLALCEILKLTSLLLGRDRGAGGEPGNLPKESTPHRQAETAACTHQVCCGVGRFATASVGSTTVL